MSDGVRSIQLHGQWTPGEMTAEEERGLVERVRLAVSAYRFTSWAGQTTYEKMKGCEGYEAIERAFQAFDKPLPAATTTRQEIFDTLVEMIDEARTTLKSEVEHSPDSDSPRMQKEARATNARYQQVLGLIGCDDKPTGFCMALKR